MASWLINIGGFAKKVKDTILSTTDETKDCGAAYLECPKCHHHIDKIDVSADWPGFPVGVKFDPSDVEILEHLAAKSGIENKKPHIFIHDFIPTLEEDQGICYTHPENLPGAKKDGSSVHFFHKTVNAYATGQRKRRKIHHHGDDVTKEHLRWHKTGKTKAVIDNGEHKGFKKIMVLYVKSEKGCKPYKSNWVMHQYHLGIEEDEKDSEYVISKIFYQKQKQVTEKIVENNFCPVVEDSDIASSRTSPETPKPDPPIRPLTGKCDYNFEDDELPSLIQDDAKSIHGDSNPQLSDHVKDEENMSNSACLANESQGASDILLCKEMLNSSALLNDSTTFNNHACNDNASPYGISNLDILELNTPPPDFDLTNLQFCSPDNSLLQCMDMI